MARQAGLRGVRLGTEVIGKAGAEGLGRARTGMAWKCKAGREWQGACGKGSVRQAWLGVFARGMDGNGMAMQERRVLVTRGFAR